MTHETPLKECAEPGCTRSFKNHYWGNVKADDWFHQKNGKSWCPEHIPDWVPDWRAKKAREKSEQEEDWTSPEGYDYSPDMGVHQFDGGGGW